MSKPITYKAPSSSQNSGIVRPKPATQSTPAEVYKPPVSSDKGIPSQPTPIYKPSGVLSGTQLIAQPATQPVPKQATPYADANQSGGQAYADSLLGQGVVKTKADLVSQYQKRIAQVGDGNLTPKEAAQWKNAAYLFGIPHDQLPAQLQQSEYALGDGKPGSASTNAFLAITKSLGYNNVTDGNSLVTAYTKRLSDNGGSLTPQEAEEWKAAATLAGIDVSGYDLTTGQKTVRGWQTTQQTPNVSSTEGAGLLTGQTTQQTPNVSSTEGAGLLTGQYPNLDNINYNYPNSQLATTYTEPNHSANIPAPTPTGITFNPNSYVAPTATMTQGTVTPEQTSQFQLSQMLDKNGILMRQSAQQGYRTAAARGLLNSSLAGQSSQEAMIKNAQPFALQDASTYAAQAQANQKATNTSELASLQNQLDVTGKATLAEQARQISLENQKYISDLQSQREVLLADVNASNDMAKQQQLGRINLELQTAKGKSDLYNALATGDQNLYNNLTLSDRQTYNDILKGKASANDTINVNNANLPNQLALQNNQGAWGLTQGNSNTQNAILLDNAQTGNKTILQTSAQLHEMDMLNKQAYINKDTAAALNGYQIQQMILGGQITSQQAKDNYGYDLGKLAQQAVHNAQQADRDHQNAVDLLNRTEAFKTQAATVAANVNLTYLQADTLAKLSIQQPQLANQLLVAMANNDTTLRAQALQNEATLNGHDTQLSIAQIQAQNGIAIQQLKGSNDLQLQEMKGAADMAVQKMNLNANVKFNTLKMLTDNMTTISGQGSTYRQQILTSDMTGPAKAILIQNSLTNDANNTNNLLWEANGRQGNPPPVYNPLPPAGSADTNSITGFAYVKGPDGYLVPQGNGQPASNTLAANGSSNPNPSGGGDKVIQGPNFTVSTPYA